MNFNSSDISKVSSLWWFSLHKGIRQRGVATTPVSTQGYFLSINDRFCSNSTSDFLSSPSPTTSSAFASAVQDYGIIESLLVPMQKILSTLADSRSVPLRRILQVLPRWFQVFRNTVTLLGFNKSLACAVAPALNWAEANLVGEN